jgi:hypothetical protein
MISMEISSIVIAPGSDFASIGGEKSQKFMRVKQALFRYL